MQKLCALLLLAISAWLLVAPFAAATAEQNLLPACCRRMGAHRCAAGTHVAAAVRDQAASFRSTGCLLLPRHPGALLQKYAGHTRRVTLAFTATWSSFFSPDALEGYARTRAIKSPRGPPVVLFSIA